MSFLFGGSKAAPAATPTTQTSFVREAPGVEERKLELMDIARQVADKPIDLPDVQVAPLAALEQAGLTQAATTGVGAPTVQQGIAQITGAAAPIGQQQIAQYFNPYQSYVIDEINRQAQMGQNRLAAQAVGAGAFGGARQGVEAAEMERRRLETIGRAQAKNRTTAHVCTLHVPEYHRMEVRKQYKRARRPQANHHG